MRFTKKQMEVIEAKMIDFHLENENIEVALERINKKLALIFNTALRSSAISPTACRTCHLAGSFLLNKNIGEKK